jgi:hypothetical protein
VSQPDVDYFELTVEARFPAGAPRDEDEMLSIGVGNATFSLVGRQPGWSAGSIGYHGCVSVDKYFKHHCSSLFVSAREATTESSMRAPGREQVLGRGLVMSATRSDADFSMARRSSLPRLQRCFGRKAEMLRLF